ncbi:hypothetical protein ACHAW5_000779 [Stephanodiscus triporus]|uniref:Uncharacterized protein n=1 Tax=Stephanodiscus triporus TaxID=2934178 RepID=A0ABD3MTP9_9STRA
MITSIADCRGDKSSTSCEVDAVHSPTEVFRCINSENWEGALDAVRCNPAEARIWISRRKSDGLVWQYLPLHLICLQNRPPLKLLHALLQLYPQAASLPTPHDGNLPIHYVCESGCEDANVFAALLASCPQSLDCKNKKDKTPLLMCHAKSRAVLMNVLRQRNPLPFKDQLQSKRKKNKQSRKQVERRNDIDTSWNETPPSVPKFIDDDEASGRNTAKTPRASNYTSKTPRASNYGRSSKIQIKDREHSPLSSNTASSGRDGGIDAATSITNFARSALTYLYPSYHGESSSEQEDEPVQKQAGTLIEVNYSQQRIIDELTKRLDHLTSSKAVNTDDSKLCERILAKAETDNVAFRTQIQHLQDEKEEMRRVTELKEKAANQLFDQIRTILSEKGSQMKIDVFADVSSSHSASSGCSGSCDVQIVEALQTVLSHMDKRNNNLHSRIALLEADLSKSEVAMKMAQSKNQLLQGEKNSITDRLRDLELKSTILEEDKVMAQTSLSELKDRVSTLTVINQSLQEQVDSFSNRQVNQELDRLNAELTQMKEVKAETDQRQAAEIEKRTKSLLEKNQSLKETILLNNSKYSKKVQELGEKNSLLEKANIELKQSFARKLSAEAQPDVAVQLKGDKKSLLYEV